MLDRMRSLTSSLTPRSASARSFWSASRRTSWIERSSSLTTSSKTNSRRRTSEASSSSDSVSASSTLRSVERSAWLRISASDLIPPAARTYSCWTMLSSFLRITASTCLTTSGLVSPIRAMRSAISACSPDGRCESTCEASEVCRRATQELERPHLDHAGQPPDDLERPLGPEGALEHLARVVDAARHQRIERLDGGGKFLEHGAGGERVDPLELCHLQRQGLDLLVAQVLEDLRRLVRSERHEQHSGLLAPLELGALLLRDGRAGGRDRCGRGVRSGLFEFGCH